MKKVARVIVVGLIMSCMESFGAKYTVTDYGANGDDTLSDREAIQKVFDKAIGATSQTEIVFPPGTYYLDRALFVFSNTKVKLDPAARIVRQSGASDKVMLIGRHYTSDGKYCDAGPLCTHGGHSQISNIEIDGGVWDAACDGSDYIGVMYLCHGQNITVRNATLKRAGDHALNVSGSADVLVSNCTFSDTCGYNGSDPEYWGVYAIGDTNRYNTIESIHLDITDVNGENGNYPMDSTACENVTVESCVFENVFAGVGNHHVDIKHLSNSITIKNTQFKNLQSYAVYAYGFKDVRVTDNRITNGAGLFRSSFADIVASDNVIVDSTEHSFFLDESTDATLLNNAVTNCTGHAIYSVGATLNASQNSIYSPQMCGIRASKSKISVSSNNIDHSRSHGISITDCANSSIIGNIVLSASQHGCVADNSNLTLSDNSISEPGRAGFWLTNCGFVELANNKVQNTGDRGLYAKATTDLSVLGNEFSSTASDGVYIDNAKTAKIIGNRIISPKGFGLRVENSSQNVIVVEGNELKDSSSHGISLLASKVQAVNNQISSAGAHGFVVNKGDVVLQGNTISKPTKAGIWLTDAVKGRMIENEIISPSDRGIYLCANGDFEISNNAISNSVLEGIYVHKTSNAKLEGNVIDSAAGIGIRVEGVSGAPADKVSLIGNVVASTTASDIRICDYATNSTVQDNICHGPVGVTFAFSAISSATYHPADAQIKKVDRTSLDKAEVSWEPVVGASGYIIETALPTTLTPIRSIRVSDPSAVQYTLDGLSSSSTWMIKVRAYQTIAGCDYESLGNSSSVLTEWTTQQYTICFHKNDGSGETQERAFEYGVKTRMPYLKSGLAWGRAGMVMKGWATSEAAAKAGTVWNLDGAYVTKPVGVGQVLNLYAIWAIDPAYYVIHYEGNGASSGTMLDQTGMKYGTTQALKANAFSRTGFVFKGWSRSATATTAVYADCAKITKPSPDPTGTVLTLYAVWAEDPACYRVEFNGNGATSGVMNTQYGFIPGKPSVTLTKNAFLRRGYDFLGWAKFPTSTSPLFLDEARLNTSTASGTTLTLYAVWKVDTNKCYSVAFDGNGAITGKMQTQEGFVAGYGTALTANAFARPGYAFLGWSRNPTATTAQYADKAKVYTPNPVVNPGETMALYAVWSVIPAETYTVHFDGNGASGGVMADQRGFVPGKGLQALTANRFVRPGYEFKGWAKYPKSTNALFSDMQKLATSTAIGTTLTLYAVWSENAAWVPPVYTVRLERNDGSGLVCEEQFTIGESRRLTSLANLAWARKGFDFVGWSRSSSAITASLVDQAAVMNEARIGESVIYYGVWKLKPTYYAIRFIKNDGSGAWRTDGRFIFGEKTRMPSLKNGLQWSRPGYNFLGWATSKANADAKKIWKGDWAYVATGVPEGTIKDAYAVWEPVLAKSFVSMSTPNPEPTTQSLICEAGYYQGLLEDGTGVYDLIVDEPWREESSAYLRIQTEEGVWCDECTVLRVDEGWTTIVDSCIIILR